MSDWRETEKSLGEVIRDYPEVSPFVILKTDIQRRGVRFTQAALEAADPAVYQLEYSECVRVQGEEKKPASLLLRDGTSVLTGYLSPHAWRNPYVIDVVDGKTVVTDEGRVLDEVFYWEKPAFYDLLTSTGKRMSEIVSARPQRLDIYPHRYCEFWDTPGHGCKYCAAQAISKRSDERSNLNTPEEIEETVRAALRQPGRFVNVFLTAGSMLGGTELLDDEVEMYLEILKRIGGLFGGRRFPSQLIGTAYNERQLRRLHDETGLMSYTADIEVLGEEQFGWICPGKAARIGYQEWKERLYTAARIFGRGNVNTGLVGGVELAKPKGFQTEDEALESTLGEAEDLAAHGIATQFAVWTVSEGSIFFRQQTPSLEYYVRLAKGLDGLRRKYGLPIEMDSYRRCGNHPDTDLSRV